MKKLLAICSFIILFTTNEAMAVPPPNGFADLVEKLTPAVVNISTTQKLPVHASIQGEIPKMQKGTPFDDFNDFFEHFGNPGIDGDDGQAPRKAISLGSGFVIDPSGYIVTNNHVIAEAEEITVIFNNEKEYKAKVIGSDSKTDLALLKITAKSPLPYVKFGDSEKARVGDWIVAIGNPFGLGGTVTAGILSARARDINAGPFDDFLQTDAPINKGNSGGPMFNMAGEVIGINTAIYSPSGGSVGIGFATPSSLAKPVIDLLRQGKKIRRGWLGVKIQGITEDIAESLGLSEDKGALVVDVTKDSPADKAGIMTGDIILSFDGKEIAAMRKLPRIVADTPINKVVKIELLRDGKPKTVTVTLGEMNEKEEASASQDENAESGAPKNIGREVQGMKIAPLSSDLRTTYNIAASVKGLVIISLVRNSEAVERGLQVGDVITGVNNQPLTTVDQFIAAISQAKKDHRKSVLLLINRGGSTEFVPLPLTVKEKKSNNDE